MRLKHILWGIVFLWMGVIFLFSSQPASRSNQTSKGVAMEVIERLPSTKNLTKKEKLTIVNDINHYIRKSAHGIIYFILALLVMLAVSHRKYSWGLRWLWTTVICAAYATLDELHQLFVVGRGCQLKDIIIDLTGALLGIILMSIIIYIIERIGKYLKGID